MTNRDDFLNLSFYAYRLTSSLQVSPLPPTPSPPGLKKNPKNEPNLNLNFLFVELQVHLLDQICLFLDVIDISLEKIRIGLQVQVLQASRSTQETGKNLNFLFDGLEVHLLNQICIFLDVIDISAEKIRISLQVQVRQASRSTLDR